MAEFYSKSVPIYFISSKILEAELPKEMLEDVYATVVKRNEFISDRA